MPGKDWRFRIEDILDAVARIESYTAGMDFERFRSDPKTADAVVRILEIIGEAAGHLPEQARGSGSEIDWRKIVGLRNILVHEYFGISKPIIWDVVQSKLSELEEACHRLMILRDQLTGPATEAQV